MVKVIRTVCQGSHSECGVLVHVEDGRVTRITGDRAHPSSRGYTCIKAQAQQEILYHPDRLRYPLRRSGARGGGQWERVSWDLALREIAGQLSETRDKYGVHSIAAMHGTGPRASLIAARLLAHGLGTPNVISVDLHICYAPSVVAEKATYGHSIMMEKGPDYGGSNCVLVWGANPLVSHPPRGIEIVEAKRKRGAKLIVVDPRRTPLASMADLWLQVRPGSDLLLAMAMINVIIAEKLVDVDFVNKWCHGYDDLRQCASAFTPENVADRTWVPAKLIREAAQIYAGSKPAVLHHRVAIEHNVNSTHTNRALACLIALTGNIDVPGGNLLPMPIKGFITTGALAGESPDFRLDREVESRRIGASEFPLISGVEAPLPFVHAPLSVESMSKGIPYPLKAMYCAGANPVVNMQDCRRVAAALRNLDLFVVSDFFMTPTAELADFVLPAATWLERDECCDVMYSNCIAARQKAVEPLYETKDDTEIVLEILKNIPWANRKSVTWDSVSEFNEFRMRGTGLNFSRFKDEGYISVSPRYRKYETEGFDTPSRKVELRSTLFEKYGYSPVPEYREPPESPFSTPQLARDYPLILISGSRMQEYYHSAGRQIRSLRDRAPDPVVELHPDTAHSLGIQQGDWVWIETPKVPGERVKMKARVTPTISPQVVHADHGWWFPEEPSPEHGCFDSNISTILSGDPPREAVCGSVPIRGTLCRLYKL